MDKIMGELPDNHISNETLWIYKDNIEIFNKYNQQVIHKEIKQEPKQEIKQEPKQEPKQEIKQEPKQEPKQEIIKKSKCESPIDLILRIVMIDKIMKDEIRTKLIDFISIPEFSKVFGMKKSSEIMTALSKDTWNQSISLFISFLLDSNIIYKEKSYIYNKEKINQTISI
jgi:hypothetical protein